MARKIFPVMLCLFLVLTLAAPASAAGYSNLADPASADWLTDYRMNSSGSGTACEAAIVTNYIAVSAGDVVRVKGLDLTSTHTNYANTPKQALYSLDDRSILSVDAASSGGEYWSYTTDGDIAVFTVLWSAAGYIRFSGELADGCSAADVVITVNEEIVTDGTPSVGSEENSGVLVAVGFGVNGAIVAVGNVAKALVTSGGALYLLLPVVGLVIGANLVLYFTKRKR